MLSILATVFFVAIVSWRFFDFIKERFVVHRIKSLLENEVSPEWIKRYKKELIGENPVINAEACDQELGKNKDIEDIIKFLLEREKIVALCKFLTNGEKLVQAGMAMVNKLLMDGIHPDNIILDTNSLGGGVAAEVLKRFKDTVRDSPHSLVKWLPSMLLNRWFGRCGLDFNPRKIVEDTKCPVLIVGRKGDTVIPQEIQLVGKLSDQSTEERLRRNRVLEHDPEIACENKNIHIDREEHLVHHKDSTIEYISYKETKNQFINEAHEYLMGRKFNEKFDQEQYSGSDLSRSLTEIELIHISKVDNPVLCV